MSTLPPVDQNSVPVKLGVWCVDGTTVIPIAIDSSNGGMEVDSVSTIGFTPGSIDFRSENYRACWLGVNSVTGQPCPIFVNSSGAVLIG